MAYAYRRWSPRVAATPDETVTVRQVVAYNLARARRHRGYTQAELGYRLEELTGARWTRAVVSQAEGGWTSTRVRHFDVNEVVAFAIVLQVPVPWFFMPPSGEPDGAADKATPWITTLETGHHAALSSTQLLEMAYPMSQPPGHDDLLQQRLEHEFPEALPPMQPVHRYRAALEQVVQDAQEALDRLDDMDPAKP